MQGRRKQIPVRVRANAYQVHPLDHVCRHSPHLERPDAVAEPIIKFVKGQLHESGAVRGQGQQQQQEELQKQPA